jgi:acyl transferase domain-containing protein
VVASRTRGGDGAWTRRASARLRNWRGPQPGLDGWQPKIEPPAHIGKERFYRALRTDGHDFGPAFRGIQSVWHEQGEVLGLVAPPPEAGIRDGYLFHPAVLDACFHVIRGFKSIISEDSDAVLALPFAVGRVVFFAHRAKPY